MVVADEDLLLRREVGGVREFCAVCTAVDTAVDTAGAGQGAGTELALLIPQSGT